MNASNVVWAPRVRTLLSVLFLLVLVLPFLLVGVLRLYEGALIRQTEEVLVSEAVVIGEVYRRALDPESALRPLRDPLQRGYEPYLPYRAQLEFTKSPILGPATRVGTVSTATQAGASVTPLLERTVIRNLTGARVVNAHGVVVASSMRQTGYSLAHLHEVQAALRGDYAPVLRKRFSDEPDPPLSSLSRAARLRVSLAVPIFEDPYARVGTGARVIGAVYNNRTPLNTTKALWQWRERLYLPLLLSLLITFTIVAFVTATIAGPLSRLRRHAEDVAEGADVESHRVGRIAPQEIHALSHSIQKMRDQLETRAEYIREFAANTAHELKTPLTSLRGAAELLIEDADTMSEAQQKRFLENIRSDALRMDGLVLRILDLARIESTKPVRETFDLAGFLDGVVERYRRHGGEVVVHYEAKDRTITYAPELLDTLVTNLLDNALRHGGAAEVFVRDAAKGRTLEVRDQGPVLPEGHFDRAFERFHSTERTRGGTGLGLATVRAIARAHGGDARAERRPEGGASIFVAL